MTNRELLELAAKACLPNESYTNAAFMRGFFSNWNPLTDDGDALRLAVKLGIQAWRDDNIIWCNGERFGFEDDDPYAATRRAIVRAAAGIGKEIDRD